MWIEVTRKNTDGFPKQLLNTDDIAIVGVYDDVTTMFFFGGADDECMMIEESYDEIKAMLIPGKELI